MDNFPDSLKRIFSDGVDSTGAKCVLSSSVSEAESESLFRAVRAIHPNVSVEIGFAHGISTLTVLSALDRNGTGHHHVIDPFQSRYDYAGRRLIQRSGLEQRYTFHELLPEKVLPELPVIDFAFIDSSHLFDLTVLEFVLIDKVLNIDGVLAIHDLWMPPMQCLVRFVLNNRSYVIDHNFSSTIENNSFRNRVKTTLAMVARTIPGADKYFTQDLLVPWFTFALPNIAFFRKIRNDERDWKFHRRF